MKRKIPKLVGRPRRGERRNTNLVVPKPIRIENRTTEWFDCPHCGKKINSWPILQEIFAGRVAVLGFPRKFNRASGAQVEIPIEPTTDYMELVDTLGIMGHRMVWGIDKPR